MFRTNLILHKSQLYTMYNGFFYKNVTAFFCCFSFFLERSSIGQVGVLCTNHWPGGGFIYESLARWGFYVRIIGQVGVLCTNHWPGGGFMYESSSSLKLNATRTQSVKDRALFSPLRDSVGRFPVEISSSYINVVFIYL